MDEMIAQCTQMMGQMGGMMGGNMMGGMMTGSAPASWPWASPWYWLGWVLVLGFTALILAALVGAIRLARRPPTSQDTPLAILQRRFARGEISPEQFEAMKRQVA